jgi:peptidoglycan/LPS O-acetylase OafA/YrhL
MRFFLALWVILYHQSTHIPATHFLPPSLFNIVRTGYAAVGVFFVLSGFILAYNYDLGTWSKEISKKFAIARFARIYPVYLFSLLILAPFWLKAMLHDPVRQAALGFWHFTLLHAWIPSASLVGFWNGPSWSISDEALFYLAFPFLGVVLWRYAKSLKSAIAQVAGLWFLIVALQLVAIWSSPTVRQTLGTVGNYDSSLINLVSFNPLLRLPEFLCGILACRLYLCLRSKWVGRGYWFYVPGLFFCIAAIALFGSRVPYIMFSNGVITPAIVLLIVGLALGGGIIERFLSLQAMVFLGGASFSMYLLHSPLRIWAAALHIPNVDTVFGTAVYICVVVLAASFLFHWFEEPMSKFVRKRLVGRSGALRQPSSDSLPKATRPSVTVVAADV